MYVAPPEVFPLLVTPHSVEFKVFAVLLLKINAVGTIFVAVPLMIVAAVSIVVAPLVVVSVIGSRSERSDEGGAQE